MITRRTFLQFTTGGTMLTLFGFDKLTGSPVERSEERAVLDAIPTPPIFQNPFMGANNFSEIHLNSYQTDTTSTRGPASASSQAVQQGLLRPITSIAGTMAFNARGQILTIRVGPSPTTPGEDAQTLLLINPEPLTVLAETDLPPRPSSGTSGMSRARTRTKPIPNRSRPTSTGESMSSRTMRSTAFRSVPAVRRRRPGKRPTTAGCGRSPVKISKAQAPRQPSLTILTGISSSPLRITPIRSCT